MIKILGIDPGKTTGLARITVDDKKIKLVGTKESKDESAGDYLDWIQESDFVILESFLVRPKNARRGSFDWDDMVAPRVIGAVTALSKHSGVKLYVQQPSIKPVGYGFANLKYVAGKQGMHQQDALAHAVFFAVTKLHALPVSK